jgi:exosortase/archaeosortase family protein
LDLGNCVRIRKILNLYKGVFTVLDGLNTAQKQFLKSAFFWFLTWQVLDLLVPLDMWLTDFVVSVSRGLINILLGRPTVCFRMHIPFEGYVLTDKHISFNIAHSCNGKAILFLFTAFLWSIPGQTVWKKMWFSLMGIGMIMIANVFRIVALFHVLRQTPKWFDFLHHGLFQWVMYGIMLFLWLLFLGKIKLFGQGSS